jgi:hypothetical protein
MTADTGRTRATAAWVARPSVMVIASVIVSQFYAGRWARVNHVGSSRAKISKMDYQFAFRAQIPRVARPKHAVA